MNRVLHAPAKLFPDFQELQDFDVDTRDEQGRSALHVAARNGQSSSVCALVELKSDTNATDKNGETPLHLAAKHGHSKSAAILIGADADLQIVSSTNIGKQSCLL